MERGAQTTHRAPPGPLVGAAEPHNTYEAPGCQGQDVSGGDRCKSGRMIFKSPSEERVSPAWIRIGTGRVSRLHVRQEKATIRTSSSGAPREAKPLTSNQKVPLRTIALPALRPSHPPQK